MNWFVGKPLSQLCPANHMDSMDQKKVPPKRGSRWSVSAHQHFIANQLRSPPRRATSYLVLPCKAGLDERLGILGEVPMKLAYAGLVSGIIAVAGLVCTATAQTADEHKIVPAPEVKWAPGPSSIPPGAQAAVLYGDPGKEGLFALRVKVPNGYHIPPHTHPKPEIVTVISGTIRLGMGTSADQSKAQPLPAGSFFAMPPGMAHYVFADGDTVIQINSTGPWGLTYLNPKDDPRQK